MYFFKKNQVKCITVRIFNIQFNAVFINNSNNFLIFQNNVHFPSYHCAIRAIFVGHEREATATIMQITLLVNERGRSEKLQRQTAGASEF